MSSVLINTNSSLGTASRSPFAGGRALRARVCTPARRASGAVTALFTRNKTDVSFTCQSPTLAQCRLVGSPLRVGCGIAGLCAVYDGTGVVGVCCIISRQLYCPRCAVLQPNHLACKSTIIQHPVRSLVVCASCSRVFNCFWHGTALPGPSGAPPVGQDRLF